MSSEELPQELDRLEITPAMPQAKIIDRNLPLTLNPFYKDAEVRREGGESDVPLAVAQTPYTPPQSHVRTSLCRGCRLRRRSESVLDDYKTSDSDNAGGTHLANCVARSLPGVQKQPFKSSSVSAGRKALIREPVLRALQTCLQTSSVRRKLMADCAEGQLPPPPPPPQSAAAPSQGISDFRELIKECQTLLDEDVHLSRRHNCRVSNSFTTMQTPSSKQMHHSRDTFKASADDTLLLPSSSITRLNTASPTLEPSAVARASTSCSQQANGNGGTAAASNCDDVNIDELASYFDTFVHIPKKMSTMAEMMYI